MQRWGIFGVAIRIRTSAETKVPSPANASTKKLGFRSTPHNSCKPRLQLKQHQTTTPRACATLRNALPERIAVLSGRACVLQKGWPLLGISCASAKPLGFRDKWSIPKYITHKTDGRNDPLIFLKHRSVWTVLLTLGPKKVVLSEGGGGGGESKVPVGLFRPTQHEALNAL